MKRDAQVVASILGASAGASGPVVLQAEGVEKTYPNGTHALDRADVTIRKGEFVSLLGPSGCGKSTLLKMFAGLEQPSGGRIRRPVEERSQRGAGGMAMVFQEATLMPWAKVSDNARLPLDRLRLILLDMMLPRVDGMFVLRRLQLADWGVPVIAMSASAAHLNAAARAGAAATLAKPFEFIELFELVERYCQPAPSAGARQPPSNLGRER